MENEKNRTDPKKVVFLGLDNAGKTSIILSLHREVSIFTVIKPTRDTERRKFKFLGMDIFEWDLGGQERYRINYLEKAQSIFRRTDILIYVVDVQDYDRIEESYNFLNAIINKLTEMNIEPSIHIFFHKNDPDITESLQIKINDTFSNLKAKNKDFQEHPKTFTYKTTVFDLSSIINTMSEILLSLFPRSKLIERTIQEFLNNSGFEGLELIDDNSLIIESVYLNEKIKSKLNSLSPYFLKLNDAFDALEDSENGDKNQIIVERFSKYYIFKQFTLINETTSYYVLICSNEPFLNMIEIDTLINVLRDIISHEAKMN